MTNNTNKGTYTDFTHVGPRTYHLYHWIRVFSIFATLSCVAVFAVLYYGTSSTTIYSSSSRSSPTNIHHITEEPGLVAATTTTTVGSVAATNSVPIFGTYPGWTQGGNLANIEVEIFIDYLCSDSKNAYPIVKDALETLVEEDYTLLDEIQLRITNFPLDFHVHSWQVGQLLPYFLDRCAQERRESPAGNPCSIILNEYMEFCFEQQPTVLSLTNMSKNDFVVYWSQQVSIQFGLESSKILAIYDRDSDVHNTEEKTRAIWKYGAAKGVSGTPLAYVNGVQLDTFPTTSTELVDLLTEVHNSQWNVSKWETTSTDTTIDN